MESATGTGPRWGGGAGAPRHGGAAGGHRPQEVAVPPAVVDSTRVRAVVFDADGVIADSAELRATAWRQALDAYTAQYVRAAGHAARPAHPGAPAGVPPGADLGPTPADAHRLLANREDRCFLELLDRQGVRRRTGSRDLLLALRARGVATAAVSAGRYCERMLRSAGLGHLFDVHVDAFDATRLGLAGPPEPGLLLHALARLDVPPRDAALVADTPAGVRAGRRGEFGLILAVDHGDAVEARRLAGADRVVHGLAEIAVAGPQHPSAGRGRARR